MRPAHITCVHCGNEATVAVDGPVPKYCSAACRSSASYSRSRRDGRWDSKLAEQRELTKRRQTDNARPCPYCGAPMTNPRRVQCGAAECRRQHTNKLQREFQHRYKTEHGNYHSRLYDKGTKRQCTITCQQCGREATVAKRTARYCSHRCWYDAKHAAHSQIELAWRPHIQVPRVQPVGVLRPLRRRWYSVLCPMCVTWFVTDNPRHRCCSKRCGKRADRDSRRAREREAFVAPVSRQQVYERDRWTCQLCRGKVRRDVVVPHPKAPTLDHVIPLSKGGTHEPANVQLAHYLCNSIKADGVWEHGEQLSLIG